MITYHITLIFWRRGLRWHQHADRVTFVITGQAGDFARAWETAQTRAEAVLLELSDAGIEIEDWTLGEPRWTEYLRLPPLPAEEKEEEEETGEQLA